MALHLISSIIGLRRYWIIVFSISILFLTFFVIGSVTKIFEFTDPSIWVKSPSIFAAIFVVVLLVADVWLPVPSSVIMIANGSLFGICTGMVLSLIGSVGACLVGFGIGRAGDKLVRRILSASEYQASEILMKKWGVMAILVTRPVPILAETVAIMAGTSSLSCTSVVLASLVGTLPTALFYALAGSTSSNIKAGLLIFPAALVSAGIFWWLFSKRK